MLSVHTISHGKEPGFLIEIAGFRFGAGGWASLLAEETSGIVLKGDKKQLKLPSTSQRWDI